MQEVVFPTNYHKLWVHVLIEYSKLIKKKNIKSNYIEKNCVPYVCYILNIPYLQTVEIMKTKREKFLVKFLAKQTTYYYNKKQY